MAADKQGESRIPLVAEEVRIDKAEVVTDRLSVVTIVEEQALLVEETVERGALDVRRIPVERAVEIAPEPRQDGDTLIVSVVEERLVVKKCLFVIEEIHITRTSTTERISIPETVRTMRATVEHKPTTSSIGRESDG